MNRKIVLASSSPRRIALLRQADLKFGVKPSNEKEHLNSALPPRKLVEKLALLKARSVSRTLKDGIVIGADTIVSVNGSKLGKPLNPKQAFRMLKLISGKKVDVYSGIAIIDSKTGKKAIDSAKTTITLRKLTDAEIRAYVKSREPLDKAGAIAIQGRGAKFVSRVQGSRSNVIGLPLEVLASNLKKFGVKLR